jgi:hypothetical protein
MYNGRLEHKSLTRVARASMAWLGNHHISEGVASNAAVKRNSDRNAT